MSDKNPFDVLRASIALPSMATRLAGVVIAANSYAATRKLCVELDKLFYPNSLNKYATLIDHDVFATKTCWTYTHEQLRQLATDYLKRNGSRS